jgi:predicted ABC-type ATPase
MKKPYLFVLVGPNGSGKTTAYKRIVALTQTRLPMINADEVERRECQDIKTPVKRSQAAQAICAKRRQDCLKARQDFGFETVGSHSSKHQFMHNALELGYDVELLFVSTEQPQINIERVAQRVAEGGHDVPRQKIVDRWHRTMSLLPQYLSTSTRAHVVDNSLSVPRLLLSKERRRIVIHPAFYQADWPREVTDALLVGINLTPAELIAAKNRLEDRRKETHALP